MYFLLPFLRAGNIEIPFRMVSNPHTLGSMRCIRGLINCFCCLMFILIGQDSGSKVMPGSLGTTQPQQEKVVGSSPSQPAVQVEDSLRSYFLMLSMTERKCSPVIFSLVAAACRRLRVKVCSLKTFPAGQAMLCYCLRD